MDKKELDQRCAEMRNRLLAPRAAHIQGAESKVKERTPARKAKNFTSSPNKSTDSTEIGALKSYIAKLEAENKGLRQQIAALRVAVPQPQRRTEDSVREQRHNFFKYSNLRR